MKVRIEIVVETEDFGAAEFEEEIKALIEDIDSDAEVVSFSMYRIA